MPVNLPRKVNKEVDLWGRLGYWPFWSCVIEPSPSSICTPREGRQSLAVATLKWGVCCCLGGLGLATYSQSLWRGPSVLDHVLVICRVGLPAVLEVVFRQHVAAVVLRFHPVREGLGDPIGLYPLQRCRGVKGHQVLLAARQQLLLVVGVVLCLLGGGRSVRQETGRTTRDKARFTTRGSRASPRTTTYSV